MSNLPPPTNYNFTVKLKQEQLMIKELIDFMKINGLSHKEFADILGVTIQAVNLWLDGKREISKTTTRLVRLFQKYPLLLREFGKC